jgi:cyclophilin family peptidyl-prolyl cis-trans isomerase
MLSKFNPRADHFGAIAASVSWLVLSACGGGGGSGGGGSPATPNQSPTASAKLGGEAVLGATTVFDSSASVDADGTIATRSWAYGDGQSGAVDNHVYAAAGSYTATLTVTDNQGAASTAQVAVTVTKCSAAGSHAATLSPFPTVCVQTSKGEMVFEVDLVPNDARLNKAPLSAANFLQYVTDGFYNGTIFHQVVAGSVIQGGGYQPGPVAKPPTYPPIASESTNGLPNSQYTLAMWRANVAVADSATSQFFINLVDNPAFNYNPSTLGANGYAVFGQVLESGRTVVDTIGAVATTTVGSMTHVPVQDVVIRSMVRLP